MKKRSMRGLAAALVLTMALPVTAFGAETVQVDGYDRMEGEVARPLWLERKPMCVRHL